jgi:NAD(P)H-hydrate repair Nnr-like enzyme with NAD(P)H-hydrate dehydratase domain
VIGLEETEEGCIAEGEVERLIEWASEAQAVLLGCGLQHGAPLDKMLDALFECRLESAGARTRQSLEASRPCRGLKAWPGGAILLPHSGEMARLLDCEREEVGADPLAAARRAVDRYGTVTLIKGQYSHIVAPTGRRSASKAVASASPPRALGTRSPASSEGLRLEGRTR